MMKSKKRLFALIVACLLCVSLPVTSFAATNKKTDTSNHIGLAAAKKIAREHAGATSDQVTYTKAKLERDDGAYEYEIKFKWDTTRYEYEIDAVSGDITSYSQSAQKTTSKTKITSVKTNTSGYIGVDKAKKIALDHAGVSASSANFTKAKQDRDDGRVEYEIEFYAGGKEYEFEIDASSGKILDYDVETRGK